MKQILILFLFVPLPFFANKAILPKSASKIENPWLTGPLFAPSSVVVPGGHVNFEPYIYIVAETGSYDAHGKVVPAKETFWANSLQPTIQVGITSWLDIELTPTLFYNYHDHAGYWQLGDFPVEIDFQLYQPSDPQGWTPAIKFSLIETFPVGKYKKFNAHKKGTQSTGEGSFLTSPGIVIGKLIHLGGIHFMTARLFFQYTFPAPTRLKGLNTYGGAPDTNAHFFPGQEFETDIGLEVTLSQNWVLACDLIGIWAKKSHFSGRPGTNPDGTPASLGSPPSSQYSLAPAIEYNWSESLGVIAGGWFTFTGHNSTRFWSSVSALNYYY